MQAEQLLEVETSQGRRVRVLATVSPRARRINLTVGAGGARVSMPEGTHPATIRAFLREHADWLAKKLRQLELTGRKLSPPVPGREDTISFRGVQLPVVWKHESFPKIRIANSDLVIGLPLDREDASGIAASGMRNFLMREIRRESTRLAAYYELRLGKSVSGFRFSPMKTLWGSLSASGHMSLDLSLILAPPKALEYVVVHEMCHLWVRNHSSKFWDRVQDVFPETEEQRDWLNRSGHSIKTELSRWIGKMPASL